MRTLRKNHLDKWNGTEVVGRKECLHPCLQTGVEAHFASYHMYTDIYISPLTLILSYDNVNYHMESVVD